MGIEVRVRVRFGFHTNEFFVPIPILKKQSKHINEWEILEFQTWPKCLS